MIKISTKNETYNIDKTKILFILSRLNSKKVQENQINNLLEKFKLYDDYFLKSLAQT